MEWDLHLLPEGSQFRRETQTSLSQQCCSAHPGGPRCVSEPKRIQNPSSVVLGLLQGFLPVVCTQNTPQWGRVPVRFSTHSIWFKTFDEWNLNHIRKPGDLPGLRLEGGAGWQVPSGQALTPRAQLGQTQKIRILLLMIPGWIDQF